MTASGSAVEIHQLTRRFGDVVALDSVSLSIAHGEFFSLLGPSGCGKTTLLRLIAGLDVADHGTLKLSGLDATELPAHRRPVNTVFQSYALFPHLNVSDNVAFGLNMKQVAAPEIARRVDAMMKLVEIETLGKRKPSELSGGQKQRVALARAIVNEPKVLLLDEPLAALDLKLRKQLQIELRALQRRLGITFIYVTHDQEEALLLSDRIAVMRDGRIEQMGEPKALYERPQTRFVSQFLGSCTLLESSVLRRDGDSLMAQTRLGPLRVANPGSCGASPTLAIRPEKIRIVPIESRGLENTASVRVESAIYAGAATHYELSNGGQRLALEVLNSRQEGAEINVGDELCVELPASALVVLKD